MAFTNAERQKRKRDKARMLQTAEKFAGPGGVDRLSVMVEAKVREALQLGILLPSIKDGLAAEKIIDARIAKTDDRQTAIALAMILSGASVGGPPAHLLVGDGLEIEGVSIEVLRPTDDDE